jgi:hypothetical protein
VCLRGYGAAWLFGWAGMANGDGRAVWRRGPEPAARVFRVGVPARGSVANSAGSGPKRDWGTGAAGGGLGAARIGLATGAAVRLVTVVWLAGRWLGWIAMVVSRDLI